jgi:hypothetical protein
MEARSLGQKNSFPLWLAEFFTTVANSASTRLATMHSSLVTKKYASSFDRIAIHGADQLSKAFNLLPKRFDGHKLVTATKSSVELEVASDQPGTPDLWTFLFPELEDVLPQLIELFTALGGVDFAGSPNPPNCLLIRRRPIAKLVCGFGHLLPILR